MWKLIVKLHSLKISLVKILYKNKCSGKAIFSHLDVSH